MPKHEEESSGAIPEWVVTFGDMMSLLLTFFVLLFSMSEIKQEHQQAVLKSLRRQFGHETTVASLVPGPVKPTNSAVGRISTMGRARRADSVQGGDKVQAPIGDYPPLQAARPGRDSTPVGAIYFDSERADLSPEQQTMLENMSAVVAGKPHLIHLKGHTSGRPLSEASPYRNHYDLAYARCCACMEHLVALGIDPARIRFSPVGKHEPANLEHDSIPGKGNDRVEVWLTDETIEQMQGDNHASQWWSFGAAE